MTDAGHILLADDEATFLGATADLLRAEGFRCTTVPDGEAALAAVAAGPVDLLITDLEMPGNADLGLVRRVAEQSGGLPVIILTGFPSVRSAVACIELPVAAYLTKPVEFPDLLDRARRAVGRFRAWQAMQRTEERLRSWQAEFAQVARVPAGGGPVPVDLFLTLTLRNVMGSLTDLEQLGRALNNQPVGAQPCQLMNCPRGAQLHEAITETIRVLEETKGAFKSKALGDLRHRLELLLAHV
ncbi:MAG: response regulator [Gemmatimonadetes bacterium]|nr:response regulator [Gemmatimonadota bacterium]MBK7351475.1 response regulator [Gemmatimonadota bacterium]MBK7786638.1 response regulator [Gemmatimonadota bacterium]